MPLIKCLSATVKYKIIFQAAIAHGDSTPPRISPSRTPVSYTHLDVYKRQVIGSALDRYTKWVAKYSAKAPDVPDVDIWQYTSSGSVPGLTGNGGRVDINHCYRDFVSEITGGCAPAPKPDTTKPASGYSPIRRDGQIHLNNFTGAGIDVDGEDGPETRRGAVMVLQTGINQDYRAGLDIDGIWGRCV